MASALRDVVRRVARVPVRPRQWHGIPDWLRDAADFPRLLAELRARPYTARPEMFRTTDGEGREQIGFRDAEPPQRSGYVGFEDMFRGSEELVRRRQERYVDLVCEHGPVLDIGCGRGEFLDLLAQAGVAASGVDFDSNMVELVRRKGHDVALADGLEYLSAFEDSSLGTIFSAQVVEHLTYTQLDRLFDLAIKKLAPGGVFIAETVNPHSIQAMHTFWVDPTHVRPLFPDVAVALCWLHGFAEATIIFPLGRGKLHHDLYHAGEYAVFARTRGTA